MSKMVSANITCPSCKKQQQFELFRTLWIEDNDNRKLLFEDKINHFACPSCNYSERLEFPFLVTNVNKKLAVWYEPYHDTDIDRDIQQYVEHMGSDSFYAKAPRITDWNKFKNKVRELESAESKADGIKLSDDMKYKLSRFIKHQKLKTTSATYPRYLRHLQTVKGRIFYAPLPFIIFCLIISITSGPQNIIKNLVPTFILAIIFSILAFLFYSIINRIILKIIPNWSRRKDIRLFCFGSLYWAIGVLLYVTLLDPYNNGSWQYMDDEEWTHMFLTILSPPIFLGSAMYIYDKYIK